MKISEFKVHPLKIPLRTPFKISAGTQTNYSGILLELQTDGGIVGWGEAAPSERVTGENTQTVKNTLESVIKPKILDRPVAELEETMTEVELSLPAQPSACCALDIALHDLMGKLAGKPIKDLIGGYREVMPISFTVVIGSVEGSLASAEEYLALGAKVLKVKLGIDPAEDIARIKALRDTFGYDIKLTGDANQGYTVGQAIKTLNSLTRFELEFVEQPVAADDLDGLMKVHEAVEIPIMADECAHGVEDVEKLVKLNAVDMINIKLMKCGGLRNAVKITSIAESAGMPCQIGCMIETGVGITAGTHLALALKNIKYADLDGHIFLKHDVVQDHQITRTGLNTVTGEPGLGIKVNVG